jgi:hypothetical protein
MTPELDWLLRRSFGPEQLELPALPDDAARARANALAQRLDVSARIVSRTPHALLVNEIGEQLAEVWADQKRTVTLHTLLLFGVLKDLDDLAARSGVSLVLLKGLALICAGHVDFGSRATADVDILVPRSARQHLQPALEAIGPVASGPRLVDDQLQGRVHPSGVLVEPHLVLGHLSLDGSSGLGADDLASANRLVPLVKPFPHLAAPHPTVLAAHLIAHAIAQHGWRPGGYPVLRVVADLQDLFHRQPPSADDVRDMEQLTTGWVSAEEVRTVLEVASRLSAGESPGDLWSDGGRGRLVRHLVEVSRSRDYEKSLELHALFDARPFDPAWQRFTRRLRRALWPPATLLATRYGAGPGFATMGWARARHLAHVCSLVGRKAGFVARFRLRSWVKAASTGADQ